MTPATFEPANTAAEILLNPANREFIQYRTADAVASKLSPISGHDTKLDVWALVKQPDGNVPIQIMADVPLVELYGFSDSLCWKVMSYLNDLKSMLESIVATDPDDIDFEIAATELWLEVKKGAQFFGLSATHDEALGTLFRLAVSEAKEIMTIIKARALLNGVTLLSSAVRLTDQEVDKVYEALEVAGFDLNGGVSF